MDGTIIDSEIQYHRILRELCAKHGKKYSKELQHKNYGCTDRQICTNVVEELQLNMSVEKLENEMAALTKTRLPKAPLKEGVERLLNHLVDSKVLFALATNATRRDVRLQMATKPHIFEMFHHMVCATDPDVDRGKPFPDVYLMAASRFPDNPLPVKCLVFEDSLTGLEAGLAAGMQVVMTPPRSLSHHLCSDATLVLKSLQDFKPELFGLPPFKE
ncbi:hypothetical protein PYW07_011266 [Mythimna separata]|uniref:Uncharacterized protein n=1 Tax=Mythimna separata TaxID=271217 RepID=A0AAD7Y9G5_MYTSE|nr:hypothetical protein PYW07_011266 [Mythimna separata]